MRALLTERTRAFPLSAMNTFPLESAATPVGLQTIAVLLGPPSPENPQIITGKVPGAYNGLNNASAIDRTYSCVPIVCNEHVPTGIRRNSCRIADHCRVARSAVARESANNNRQSSRCLQWFE